MGDGKFAGTSITSHVKNCVYEVCGEDFYLALVKEDTSETGAKRYFPSGLKFHFEQLSDAGKYLNIYNFDDKGRFLHIKEWYDEEGNFTHGNENLSLDFLLENSGLIANILKRNNLPRALKDDEIVWGLMNERVEDVVVGMWSYECLK